MEKGSFVDYPNLAKWENPSDRLAYYRGHRAGSEARGASNNPNPDARQELFGGAAVDRVSDWYATEPDKVEIHSWEGR
jgi:hypothetical protein